MFCVEKQNYALMQTNYIFLALLTPEWIQRKFGPPGQLNWKALNSKDTPTLLKFDTNAEAFYFENP